VSWSLFRQVTRTVTVSYPIPFIVSCLLAFALAFVGFGTAATSPWIAAPLITTGCLIALAAVAYAGYALLRRPDLLRSERFNLVNRYIDVIGDNEVNRSGRDALDRTVLAFLDEDVSKKAVPPSSDHGNGGAADANQ
jgi:hypothetical protein